MSCLSDNGVCVLEYSDICDIESKVGSVDAFGATLEEYKEFISEKYKVLDILTNDGVVDNGESYKGNRYYIIIGK
jgi:hypothetical protein